jgi:hypothetical protein
MWAGVTRGPRTGRKLWSAFGTAWAWATVAAALVCGRSASGQAGDFSPESAAWNGLTELVALAREQGVDLRVTSQVELSTLRPGDGVLLVHPTRPPPRADLSAFMVEGGRLALADDFGAGDDLLRGFGIQRAAVGEVGAGGRLRDNRNVLLARPTQAHPLAQDVRTLVVNHAQVLSHAELSPIFALQDAERSAVALAGAVGKGRLVVLGDPSALINNMLELRDNRTFARNLLRYVARDGRLLLAVGDVRWVGRHPSLAKTDPLAGVRDALARLADANLPPLAVQLSAAIVALVLLAATATMLPRREHFLRAVALPRVAVAAGFAGRVRHFARRERDLAAPALAYKQGFERALVEALGLHGTIHLRDLEGGLSRAGLPRELRDDAGRLLSELQALEQALARTDVRRDVGPRKLHALVTRGERILGALAALRPGQAPR